MHTVLVAILWSTVASATVDLREVARLPIPSRATATAVTSDREAVYVAGIRDPLEDAAASPLLTAFLAKTNRQGTTEWVQEFQGNDIPRAMAVDALRDVYVAQGNVLRKFSANGSTIFQHSIPGANILVISVSSSAVFAGGFAYAAFPATPGVLQPKYEGIVIPRFSGNGFVAKMDPQTGSIEWATFVGGQSSLVKELAIPADGSSITAAGTSVWRLSADGTTLPSTGPADVNVASMHLNPADGSIVACTVPVVNPVWQGAIQSRKPPYIGLVVPDRYQTYLSSSFHLAVEYLEPNAVSRAGTYLGGEGAETCENVLPHAPTGVAIFGNTTSKQFPTRFTGFGPLETTQGFLSIVADEGRSLVLSTYLPAPIAGAAASPEGGWWVPANLNGAVVLWRISISEEAPPPLTLIDALNEASRLPGPISAGESLLIRGAGFTSQTNVLIDGTSLNVLSRMPGEIVALAPPELAAGQTVALHLEDQGTTTNPILLSTADATPAIYTYEWGIGQAIAWNQDGTVNSPENPAPLNSRVAFLVTGAGPACERLTVPAAVFSPGKCVVEGRIAPRLDSRGDLQVVSRSRDAVSQPGAVASWLR